jgi:hypothetical protein
MEYCLVNGKKANSKIFYVIDIDQLFLSKNVKENNVIYLNCYYSGCNVSGKVVNEKFYHVNHGCHENHDRSVSSLLNEWKFYDDLRKQTRESTNPLKVIFDDVHDL